MRRLMPVITGLLILGAGAAVAEPPTLKGTGSAGGVTAPPPEHGGATEVLQVGDFTPEIGIGCSNENGTSGGPNSMALQVTATSMPPTFYLQSATYYSFTQSSPTITQMLFAIRVDGPSPGATAAVAPIPFLVDEFNVAVFEPRLPVGEATAPGGRFYIGLIQSQTDVGFRAGVDTSSGSDMTSYIRAPACGAANFTLLDTLGFPGNWVIRAIANELIPVELMTFQVSDG